jgi:hypothetical protein
MSMGLSFGSVLPDTLRNQRKDPMFNRTANVISVVPIVARALSGLSFGGDAFNAGCEKTRFDVFSCLPPFNHAHGA